MTSSLQSALLRLSTIAPLSGLDAHRRRRTAFTSDQLLELEKENDVTAVCDDVGTVSDDVNAEVELEKEFHSKKYLSLTERSQLAHDLQLSEVLSHDQLKQ